MEWDPSESGRRGRLSNKWEQNLLNQTSYESRFAILIWDSEVSIAICSLFWYIVFELCWLDGCVWSQPRWSALYISLRFVQCNCPSCVMVRTLCTKADARVLDAAFVCYQSIAVFCKRVEEYKERQGPLKRLKPRRL